MFPSRKWINKYDNVKTSLYGRGIKKYDIDFDYYNNLSRTKFALCPIGDCNWSYRVFESIMCRAIPVIGDGETDIFIDNFKFFRDGDVKYITKSTQNIIIYN